MKKALGFSDKKNIKEKAEEELEDITDGHKPAEKKGAGLKEFLSRFKIHKSPGKKEPFRVKPGILLPILAFICVALIILSAVFEQVAYPFKTAASLIVVPAQEGINEVGSWIVGKIDTFKSIEKLAEENEELKATIEELRSANRILSQENSEVERLRELLDLASLYSDYDTVAARIISKDTSNWFSSFTIDKGEEDGILKNMNVIAEGGLVGVITDVGRNYAVVRTVINSDSNISAVFAQGTDLCVVSGGLSLMEDNLIEFSEASVNVDIKEGDSVLTSNVSSIYLPGLLIGYVADCRTDGNLLTQSGHITVAVDFTNLSEVLIITQLKETGE